MGMVLVGSRLTIAHPRHQGLGLTPAVLEIGDALVDLFDFVVVVVPGFVDVLLHPLQRALIALLVSLAIGGRQRQPDVLDIGLGIVAIEPQRLGQ